MNDLEISNCGTISYLSTVQPEEVYAQPEPVETTQRKAEWGNWGLTFFTEHRLSTDGYARYEIHGRIFFPCGAQGPTDGFVGSSQHESYKQMIKAWQTDGVLPENLTK
jgi:hypothetical protein